MPAKKTDTYSTLNRNGLVVSGSVLELHVDVFPAVHRPAIKAWLAEMPPSARFAGWVDERYVLNRHQLRWAFDGSKYTAAGLVAHIVHRALGPNQEITISGWHLWITSGGTSLFELAHQRPKN
ncbi:hypothetical protein ACIGXM_14665 [Kitasatospora sp. NPDC052896]|uniref:hypothetical protein n=1 Tax=Kitasatospora sp. NPDC052896 TaxID=3364061 RepID=UPI0037CA03BC